jgi:hypothetical protein
MFRNHHMSETPSDKAYKVTRLLLLSGGCNRFKEELRRFCEWCRQWNRETPKRPPESSPWELLRSVPSQRLPEQQQAVLEYMFPPEVALGLDKSLSVCLQFVRLAILHDMALREDGAINPVTRDVLDSSEVEYTYGEMSRGWSESTWPVVIDAALAVVEDQLKSTKCKSVFGDSITLRGLTIHWRNVIPWFQTLIRGKKPIVTIIGALLLLLAILTRSQWLPRLARQFGAEKVEQKEGNSQLPSDS